MAWVNQMLCSEIVTASLCEHHVLLRFPLCSGLAPAANLQPSTSSEAHRAALVLRRAARRLEEIGQGLA